MLINELPIRERQETDYIIVQTDEEATARVLFSLDSLGIASKESVETLTQTVTEFQTTVEQTIIEKVTEVVQEQVGEIAGAVYTPKGSVEFASLPPIDEAQVGWVYNVTDTVTTTNDFVEGPGKEYSAGTNIVAVEYEVGTKKWDVLGEFVDLTPYAKDADLKTLSERVTVTEGMSDMATAAKEAAQAAQESVEALTTSIQDTYLEKD